MREYIDKILEQSWENEKELEALTTFFDTEKIWHKIEKPKAKKTVLIPIYKYAAAIVLGALLTYTLMPTQSNTATIASSAINKKTNLKPITIVIQLNNQSTKNENFIPKNNVKNVFINLSNNKNNLRNSEEHKNEMMISGTNYQTLQNPPFVLDQEAIVVQKSNTQKRKTIHISELEAPPLHKDSKSNNIFQYFQERSQQSYDDIAISTKIIKKLN